MNGNPTPAILAAYLFGSHSTGKAKLRSDPDLPVLLFPGQEKPDGRGKHTPPRDHRRRPSMFSFSGISRQAPAAPLGRYAQALQTRLDAIRNAPLPLDNELPEFTEKQRSRIEVFALREEETRL